VQPRLLQDPIGGDLAFDAPPRRIVSLVPPLTELLFDLGVGDRVVGVSRECREPAAALAGLPRVGRTRDPEVAAVRALEPDLVFTVAEDTLVREVRRLEAAGVAVYQARVESVEDAVGLIGEVGDVVDAPPPAVAALFQAARRAVYEARKIAASHPAVPVFCPLWRDPWITFAPNTYPYDVLEACGARPVTVPLRGAKDRRYPIAELAAVAAAQPALVLLPDRPFPFGPADVAELERLLPEARILRCDGRDLMWYGRRMGALPSLAERIGGQRPDRGGDPP
jgi:ABC-type Fe3+-hydroxamate transport system substrate-binding protein